MKSPFAKEPFVIQGHSIFSSSADLGSALAVDTAADTLQYPSAPA